MSRDFWAFRTMITPVIIQILFWIGVVACIIGGLFLIATAGQYPGQQNALKGLALLILGPIGVRIYAEILIVFFRINETLTEIKHAVEGRKPEA